MTLPGEIWVPRDEPILPASKRTIAYGAMARDLKAYGEESGQKFVILVQGNHHETFERMESRLKTRFSYESGPFPAYRGVPFGLAATVEFERTFLGAPATVENTFIPKQQGRFCYLAVAAALNRYHGRKGQQDFADIEPNLRWRVLDDEREFIKQNNPVDYDVTAPDVVQSIKAAVDRADGPEKAGSLYLCSPNNPTGRRFTEQEYRAIKDYVVEVNRIRVSQGLGKMIIVCDDPYFEACEIRHRDAQRAASGRDSYLAANYAPLAEGDELAPVVFLHSLSKFAEQAGSNGATIMVSTDPEFTAHLKDALSVFGGLAYGEEYLAAMGRFFDPDPENIGDLLDRCEQAGRVFRDNSVIMERMVGANMLDGQPNMVRCYRVLKERFKGVTVQYGSGKKFTLGDDAGDIATVLANGFGVALAPETDDMQIRNPYGYDPEKEVLLRAALNEDPAVFHLGIKRALHGGDEIQAALLDDRVLKFG